MEIYIYIYIKERHRERERETERDREADLKNVEVNNGKCFSSYIRDFRNLNCIIIFWNPRSLAVTTGWRYRQRVKRIQKQILVTKQNTQMYFKENKEDWLIDRYYRPVNPLNDILCLEVRDSYTLYIHTYIFLNMYHIHN